jgi:hypothetical protein
MENTNNQPKVRVPLIKGLFDFKFEQSIYMRVASFLYAFIVILTLVVALVAMFAIPPFSLVLAPLGALVLITLFRLVFESGNALIVIAENSKKK